jgi:hypothetical protein
MRRRPWPWTSGHIFVANSEDNTVSITMFDPSSADLGQLPTANRSRAPGAWVSSAEGVTLHGKCYAFYNESRDSWRRVSVYAAIRERKGMTAPASDSRLHLADLLAALSVVTDLGHGRPPEDAMRACLLATRLADHLGVAAKDYSAVYYTSLLRYIGCTAYAHEEAVLFGGDEIAARAAVSTLDLANPREALSFWFSGIVTDRSPL